RNTRIWGEVVDLGGDLHRLAPLRGSEVLSDTAIVWDWESWWAMELEWRPTRDHGYLERVHAYYEWLWRTHRTVDFVPPEADLGRYRLVVVPSLYLATRATA